jgi:hypothetical protein
MVKIKLGSSDYMAYYCTAGDYMAYYCTAGDYMAYYCTAGDYMAYYHNLYISTFYYTTDCQEISDVERHIP